MTGPTIESLLREHAPRVLAVVARRHRDFADAEDAVQEALVAAAERWPQGGVPDNPAGWLVHVALRRLADQARSAVARRRREATLVSEPWAEFAFVPPPDAAVDPTRDETLALLFTCCHPSVSTASAVALTLRAVAGLTTAEIAAAFLVPEATMAQRISRAKQSIRASAIPFALPPDAELAARLDAVRHVVYLVFNEGYAAAAGDALMRLDLAEEGIRLARLLHALRPDDAESTGLLALLLLTHARRHARTDARGALVPLDEQDRGRWDRALIAEGTALVADALPRGAVGAYQLQAAIAALHGEAPSVEATDWAQIAALYAVLARVQDTPVVALNRAVAIAMVEGPRAGLARLDALADDPRLATHHRLPAVRAHLLERAGDRVAAVAAYRRAAELAPSVPERDYLLARAARVDG